MIGLAARSYNEAFIDFLNSSNISYPYWYILPKILGVSLTPLAPLAHVLALPPIAVRPQFRSIQQYWPRWYRQSIFNKSLDVKFDCFAYFTPSFFDG